MKADSQVLYPNLQEWQLSLLEELQKKLKSGNRQPVILHHRRLGKSWIQKWLNENVLHNSKLSERNYVQPHLITREPINTLALKSKPNILVGKQYDFIIFDEWHRHQPPYDEKMKAKLDEIVLKMKNSFAESPNSMYNSFINWKEKNK